jgi:hypothetical protein
MKEKHRTRNLSDIYSPRYLALLLDDSADNYEAALVDELGMIRNHWIEI